MKNRNTNMIYAIEVLNGRLTTSSDQVEKNIERHDNITFTKKVDRKGYSPAVSIKKNVKGFMINQGFEISEYKKGKNQPIAPCHPAKFVNEDLFGDMRAEKETITEDEYNKLEEDIKKLYSKPKKGVSERNITKKRRGNFALNGLIGVNRGKVQKEFGTCVIKNDYPSLYTTETYSDIMVGLGNLNINGVSKFIISGVETEFRDYTPEEAITLNIKEELPKEEKYRRIEVGLRSIQYLSMKSNQSNYLVDTMTKIVIMSEYSWGNNVFQGLINKNGINIEGLKEVIEEYDDFRISDIWIGVSNRIENENFQGLKEKLQEELKEYKFIHIGGVKSAFDGYLDFVKETL